MADGITRQVGTVLLTRSDPAPPGSYSVVDFSANSSTRGMLFPPVVNGEVFTTRDPTVHEVTRCHDCTRKPVRGKSRCQACLDRNRASVARFMAQGPVTHRKAAEAR